MISRRYLRVLGSGVTCVTLQPLSIARGGDVLEQKNRKKKESAKKRKKNYLRKYSAKKTTKKRHYLEERRRVLFCHVNVHSFSTRGGLSDSNQGRYRRDVLFAGITLPK